jgi:2-dehydropantoate 2-reductase
VRVVIVGAGAIGGTIGGRLFQHGHDVVLVARGAHGEALRRDGLLLRDPDGEARLAIPTALAPAEVDWRDGDVVVLATKTQDADGALAALAASAPPATPIVCATNGVEAERLALRRFAAVHAMCVMMPAAHLEPGVVDAHSAPTSGLLDLGRYPEGTDDVDEAVAAALSASTFASVPRPDILRWKRAKLLLNLANILEAATGGADTADLWSAARDEAVACFAAAGLAVATEEEDRARRGDLLTLRPIAGQRRGGGTTWQSLARGAGSTEADYLNGEIVLLGRQHGVPTPVNEALQRLAAELAAGGRPPGSCTADEIRSRANLR